MAALLTPAELKVWTRTEIADDDPFALAVIDAVSLIVCDEASHPEWTSATAPARAKLIATLVAKRNYLNPDAIVSSNVGPIGERTIEDFARTMELTETEKAELQAMAGDEGDEPGLSPDLWIQPTSRGDLETDIYLDDAGGEWSLAYADKSEAWAFTPEA